MFILSHVKDLVRIAPDQFHHDTLNAITHQLNHKYANKVIPQIGLCISVYDVLEIDEGQIKPGDGASFINVEFRALVFKPFVGEVLTGWITKCNNDGIQVSMGGLFNDIFIPRTMMFENCFYKPDESAWLWQMDEDTELYFDINELIRFRVEKEIFFDIKPKDPSKIDATTEGEGEDTMEKEDNSTPAYALLGSCQTDGMGVVSWWE